VIVALALLASLFSELQWRHVGPFRGGRTKAATGVQQRPGLFYIGAGTDTAPIVEAYAKAEKTGMEYPKPVVAVHEKPIDDRNGKFYAFMRSLGINPKHELWTIMKEFGLEAAFEYRD